MLESATMTGSGYPTRIRRIRESKIVPGFVGVN
jgi:hypothetical protein